MLVDQTNGELSSARYTCGSATDQDILRRILANLDYDIGRAFQVIIKCGGPKKFEYDYHIKQGEYWYHWFSGKFEYTSNGWNLT
jgi:hypothetical protein